MSTRRPKRNAREAEISEVSSIDTTDISELFVANSNDPAIRTRLWSWLDTKFTKQNEYIQEQSETIKTMIENNKSSLILEIEKKFRDFKNEIMNDVKKELHQLNERVTKLETANSEINKLKNDVHNLNMKILAHDNSVVASDIRITGIPFYENEDLPNMFGNICGVLKATVPSHKAIFRVKRFKHNRDVSDPPIIVKMSSPYEKNLFLKTAAGYRQKNKSPLRLCDAGFDSNKPFYINENLTPHNHDIFKTALNLKKNNCLKAAYTRRGIVYVKGQENDDPIKIDFPDQLRQFFRA